MTEAEQVMKRCQIGTRNYNEANNLHADCYRVIGKLLAEHAMRETQRLGQEIEQEPVIGKWSLREVYFDEDGEPISHRSPPQRTEQEPVALHVYKPTLPRGHLGNVLDGDLPWVYDQDPSSGYSARMLVHTTPPQRKPLTNEEIDAIADEYLVDYRIPAGCALNFARDIEAAHGIKGGA